jgi:short-subunit dehydrogenase
MHLEKQRIILTGAASGIGYALLRKLNHYPAQIIAVDIHQGQLNTRLDQLPPGIAQIEAFVCNLAQQSNVDALFAHALALWGNIDLFLANAGFAYYEQLNTADWAHLERIYQVNVFSPIYAAVKMRELHPDQAYKVVVTASAMGLLAIPGYAIYGSTKAALDRFAEGYRFELNDPSTLTLVYPIGTRTDFFKSASSGHNTTPAPWPTQSAEHVADVIIRGIQCDQPNIFPSRLFQTLLRLDRILPFIRRVEQRIEQRRFQHWVETNTP